MVLDASSLAFLSLTFALVITPGSTTAVVVRNTLAAGRRGGLLAAMGAALGNSIHALGAGLGLAVVLARSPRLFVVIQVAGGLYLAWLALQSLLRIRAHRPLPASHAILANGRARPHHALREGLTVNLLNPAIATFYLAVVPSFLPDRAGAGPFAALAATHVAMAFCVHTTWVLALHHLRHVLERPTARVALELVTALALGVLAGRIFVAGVTSN